MSERVEPHVPKKVNQAVSGCPCDECEGFRRLSRRRHKQRVMGRYAMTDAGPSRDQLARLIANGWTLSQVGRVAGIPLPSLTDLHSYRFKRIKTVTAQKLAALPDQPPADKMVSNIGVLRRIEALCAIGWTHREISERAGLHSSYAANTRRYGYRVTREVAEAIYRVYDELSMTPSTGKKANRARTIARSNGWAPPLAWDDIDDPDEIPATGRKSAKKQKWEVDEAVVARRLGGDKHVPLTDAERREIVRRARERGWSLSTIEMITGITKPDRFVKEAAA